MASPDYYAVLGVPPNATPAEIKARYRFLSHAYHPDKFASDDQRAVAEEEFKRMNAAYQVLSDPAARAEYDEERGTTSVLSETDDEAEWTQKHPTPDQSAPSRPRQPYAPPPITFAPPTAKWSLALGIFSLAGGLFTSIPAILCGHRAISLIKRLPNRFCGQRMAFAGLTLGYLVSVLYVGGIVAGLLSSRAAKSTSAMTGHVLQMTPSRQFTLNTPPSSAPEMPFRIFPINPSNTPTPEQSGQPRPAGTPVTISSSSTLPMPLVGERFPDTRIRFLTQEEIGSRGRDNLQYAINEIFARHGAQFPDKSVQGMFSRFPWYHAIPQMTFDEIEKGLPEPELANLKSLAAARDRLRNQKDAAAGPWFGVLHWKTYNGQQFETKCDLVFDDNLTEVAGRSITPTATSDWVTYHLDRRGRILRWVWPGTPGSATYITLNVNASGNSGTATSQWVDRGKTLATGFGTFGRTDVPLPVVQPIDPNPIVSGLVGGLLQGLSEALQNSSTSGNATQTNVPTIKHHKKP